MTVFRRAAAGLRNGLLAHIHTRRSRVGRMRLRAARAAKWYEIAGNDPAFLADMAETDRAFDVAVADGLEHEGVR